jgi:ribonuclease HI
VDEVMAKQKFYVVWAGKNTGIFNNWPEVQKSVIGYKGAKHKSFPTLAEAEAAFSKAPEQTRALSSPAKVSKNSTSTTVTSIAMDPLFDVHIFSDGGCDPNPGEAASGVAVYESGSLRNLYHGLYDPNGTNNTAELNALHQAMLLAERELKQGKKVQILSDSTYSVNSMTLWGEGWKRSGRLFGKGKALANRELIAQMLEVYIEIAAHINLVHVKAHIGIEGNELADRMCTLAIRGKVVNFEPLEEPDIAALLAVDSC